ncbi:MAG TPA: hypothetical protein VM870_09290, partial [Pyrinomonadaceae bacterium]|nr:hypothetical protein [Pyrinomonadaceae bacterium]
MMKLKNRLSAVLLVPVILLNVSGQTGTPERPRANASSTIAAAAVAAATVTREERIAQAAEALRPQLIAQRRDFHMHPELSNREERTARIVAERLKSLGFDDVRTNVARHGVVGVLKGGRPGAVVA